MPNKCHDSIRKEMSVQRYEPDYSESGGDITPFLRADKEGECVLYSDHVKLINSLEEMRVKHEADINKLVIKGFNQRVELVKQFRAEMVALCDEVRELMLIHTDADTNDISFVCNQLKHRIQSEGLGDDDE